MQGIGDEVVVALTSIGFFLLFLTFLLFRFIRQGNSEMSEDVSGEPLGSVVESTPTVSATCPICLAEARMPLQTNCSHYFCTSCLIEYWRHSGLGRLGAIRCPVCRGQVTVFLPCFRPFPDASQTNLSQAINDYNRRFSGEPRPWIDYIRDLPTLLRHLSSEFVTLGGVVYMLRIRIVLCFVAAIMYLVSPLDLIPEAFFGVLGFLDDLFVVLLLALYVSIIYRRFLASRWESDPHDHED